MRSAGRLLWIPLAVALSSPALAAEKSGVGFGLVRGVVDSDDLTNEIEFGGLTVYGKIGITDNWGILITYRDMEDDEDFPDEEDEYTQIAAQAVYLWRAERIVRPYIKFGLERTDFESRIDFGLLLGTVTLEDDETSIAVGGGLEVGSQKVAFFGDYDFTLVELFEDSGFTEDFAIANLTLGIIFKF